MDEGRRKRFIRAHIHTYIYMYIKSPSSIYYIQIYKWNVEGRSEMKYMKFHIFHLVFSSTCHFIEWALLLEHANMTWLNGIQFCLHETARIHSLTRACTRVHTHSHVYLYPSDKFECINKSSCLLYVRKHILIGIYNILLYYILYIL